MPTTQTRHTPNLNGHGPGIRIYVAIPCYGGQMHATCSLSLIDLERQCQKNNIELEYQMVLNESLIARGRNLLVNEFMKTSCTHLLFIDSDIQFDAKDIINMVNADKDVIGGVYAKKELLWDKIASCVKNGKPNESLQYNTSGVVFWPLDDFPQLCNHKIDDPLEVKYIGTGLMLVKRAVFQRIKDTYPLRVYDYKGASHYCYFDCKIENNNYLSEDYYFCQTWRDLGGQVYAAMWTKTTHYGNLGLHTNLLYV